MRISLRQLEIFVAITKADTLSQAGEQLHLSQSALSMGLMNLEQQLGGKLFDRQGKQLRLTGVGQLLLPKASNILAQVSELESVMLQNQPQGQLTIGASTTIANYLLPVLIAEYMTLHAASKIDLRVHNTEGVVQEVLKFNIDMGIIEGSCNHPDIEMKPWRHDELVVITSPNHPLALKSNLSLTDLQNAKWILREPGSGTREIFEQAMGQRLPLFLEFGHTEAIKRAVEAGLGVSCLPKLAVEQALKAKHLVALATPFLNLTRNLYLLVHKDKYQTQLLQAFMDYCQKSNPKNG